LEAVLTGFKAVTIDDFDVITLKRVSKKSGIGFVCCDKLAG
jgi:hypothetical protein